jgi:hypothetical protein
VPKKSIIGLKASAKASKMWAASYKGAGDMVLPSEPGLVVARNHSGPGSTLFGDLPD